MNSRPAFASTTARKGVSAKQVLASMSALGYIAPGVGLEASFWQRHAMSLVPCVIGATIFVAILVLGREKKDSA